MTHQGPKTVVAGLQFQVFIAATIVGRCLESKKKECCMEPICRSLTFVFKNICLDGENILTATHNLADIFVFTPICENKAMDHVASR